MLLWRKIKNFEVNNETLKASNDRESIVDESDSEKVKNVFVEDIEKPMDDLVDDARKKVEAPPKTTLRKTAIPNDIYNSVDECKNAKEMWEQIKRLMFGSDATSHVRHSRLMDEFVKFRAKEGESLEFVYERQTMLVNSMEYNNVCPIPVSINTKFLNFLQPEWIKYVTMVHHNQTGDTVSYDVLYDTLVQFEPHVLASDSVRENVSK
ncbi:hypothetical protein Tco_0086536 [Tanacetum coccineum]